MAISQQIRSHARSDRWEHCSLHSGFHLAIAAVCHVCTLFMDSAHEQLTHDAEPAASSWSLRRSMRVDTAHVSTDDATDTDGDVDSALDDSDAGSEGSAASRSHSVLLLSMKTWRRAAAAQLDTHMGELRARVRRLQRRVRDSPVVRTLKRRFSAATRGLRRALHPTYFCHICQEACDASTGAATSFELRNCGHVFCAACLAGYVRNKVREGLAFPYCFHPVSASLGSSLASSLMPRSPHGDARTRACKAVIHEADIRALLAPEEEGAVGSSVASAAVLSSPAATSSSAAPASPPQQHELRLYNQLLVSVARPHDRECPNAGCACIVRGDPASPAMTCGTCGTRFCFYHARAHSASTSCHDYEAAHAPSWAASAAWMAQSCKSCPRCAIAIEKSDGCNSMRCSRCGVGFCWLCLRVLDDATGGDHFAWWNITGCPQKMLRGTTRGPFSDSILMNVLYAVACILLLPLVLIAGIVVIAAYFCMPSMASTPPASGGRARFDSEALVQLEPVKLSSPLLEERAVAASSAARLPVTSVAFMCLVGVPLLAIVFPVYMLACFFGSSSVVLQWQHMPAPVIRKLGSGSVAVGAQRR